MENKLDAIVTRSSASVKPEDRPSTPKVQRALSVDAGSEVQVRVLILFLGKLRVMFKFRLGLRLRLTLRLRLSPRLLA